MKPKNMVFTKWALLPQLKTEFILKKIGTQWGVNTVEKYV